jgi:hypothetical protein
MPKGPSYLLILVVLGVVLMIGGAAFPWEHFSPDAYGEEAHDLRYGRDDQVLDAKFRNDRLWILSRSGKLWSVVEGDNVPVQFPLIGRALALCARPEGFAVAIQEPGRNDLWRIQEQASDAWRTLGFVRKNGEGLAGLACDTSGVTVLTTRRAVSFDGATTHTMALSRRIPIWPDHAVLTTPGQIWVALREGEFGGGLMAIDRGTGEVREFRRNDSGELCGGPLSPECDPVNAVTPLPWKPDCMVATVGLQHFGSRGRLISICGDRIEPLYSGPCMGPDGKRWPTTDDDWCSEALYSMVRKGDALLISGSSGFSLVGSAGLERPETPPPPRQYGPFEIGFGQDVITVRAYARLGRNDDDPFWAASDLLLVERNPA